MQEKHQGKNEYNEYNHIAFISYTNGVGEEVEIDILSKTAPNNLTEADKIIAIKNINSYEKEKEQLYNGTIPDFIQLVKDEEAEQKSSSNGQMRYIKNY